MNISDFINKSSQNVKFSELLEKYDTDKNGFTQKEFRTAILGITNGFARGLIKISRYDKKFFKDINTDKNEVVSYEELAEYIKKEYKLDFYSFKDMTLKEVCDALSAQGNKQESRINTKSSHVNKLAW